MLTSGDAYKLIADAAGTALQIGEAGRKAPEHLFHYTNACGLYGILESKTLRATSFQFLNDPTEYLSRPNISMVEKLLVIFWQPQKALLLRQLPSHGRQRVGLLLQSASLCCLHK